MKRNIQIRRDVRDWLDRKALENRTTRSDVIRRVVASAVREGWYPAEGACKRTSYREAPEIILAREEIMVILDPRVPLPEEHSLGLALEMARAADILGGRDITVEATP